MLEVLLVVIVCRRMEMFCGGFMCDVVLLSWVSPTPRSVIFFTVVLNVDVF